MPLLLLVRKGRGRHPAGFVWGWAVSNPALATDDGNDDLKDTASQPGPTEPTSIHSTWLTSINPRLGFVRGTGSLCYMVCCQRFWPVVRVIFVCPIASLDGASLAAVRYVSLRRMGRASFCLP